MDVFHSMRVFIRVAEAGSFTTAAQALDLSTAQVSRLVSDLENLLQARLLQRSTRRQALTEVGVRYLARSRQILSEMEDANAEARGAQIMPRGRLRMQSTTGLGIQLLTPLAARYADLYPEVILDMTLSQTQPDLLAEGQDVVIMLSRDLPDSQLVGQHLGTINSVVCAAPSYLERHGTPLSPNDLIRHRCMHLVDPVFTDNWTFNDNGTQQSISLDEAFKVNVAEAMVQAAEAGLGICLLPDYVAVNSFKHGTLVRVLSQHRLNAKNIYVLYPSRRFLDAKVKTWIDFLKREVPDMLLHHQAILNDPAYQA